MQFLVSDHDTSQTPQLHVAGNDSAELSTHERTEPGPSADRNESPELPKKSKKESKLKQTKRKQKLSKKPPKKK